MTAEKKKYYYLFTSILFFHKNYGIKYFSKPLNITVSLIQRFLNFSISISLVYVYGEYFFPYFFF